MSSDACWETTLSYGNVVAIVSAHVSFEDKNGRNTQKEELLCIFDWAEGLKKDMVAGVSHYNQKLSAGRKDEFFVKGKITVETAWRVQRLAGRIDAPSEKGKRSSFLDRGRMLPPLSDEISLR